MMVYMVSSRGHCNNINNGVFLGSSNFKSCTLNLMTQYSDIEEELHIGKNVKKKDVTAEHTDVETNR
jgi:hypothetical protein